MEKSYAIRPAIWTALETKNFTIWDAYHDDLKRWYIDEGCSLKIVKTKMENEHGFPSTPLDQYEIVLRDHFHFRKNLEQRDWAFIAQRLGERRRHGKDSNVYLDCKLLERKRIQRGIRRYGGKKVRRSHKMHQLHSEQPKIFIRTPSPEPKRQIRVLGNISSLNVLGQLLFSTRSFLESRSQSYTYPGSQSEDVALLHEQLEKFGGWFNDFHCAIKLLRKSQVSPAFRILQQCFDNTSIIVRSQHPFMFLFVGRQLVRCIEYDINLARMLLRYFAGLCRIFYGASYPLYTITNKLSQMDSFELTNHIKPLISSYHDILESIWRKSPVALAGLMYTRGDFVKSMEGAHMIGFEEARTILDNLVRKAKDYGTSTVHLRMIKAAMLQRNGYLHEALSLILEVCDSQETSYRLRESSYARSILIRILRAMGDYDGVIRASYEMVDFLSTSPGSEYDGEIYSSMICLDQRQSYLITILEELERDLRKSGRIEEAEAVHCRREDEVHTLSAAIIS